MRVMIDTNIIISAALFPKGKTAQALYKALSFPYEPILCDYVIDIAYCLSPIPYDKFKFSVMHPFIFKGL